MNTHFDCNSRRAGGWLFLACISVLCSPGAATAEWPAWVESWLFNAEERTERAVDGFETGDLESAAPSFETALRLDPANPTTQFNAGTSRLASGTADPTELLSSAAASGSADLAAAAAYNLGNAQMERDAYSEAIESYKSALRSSPGMTDAKFNLELAKKRLEQQQQQQQEQDGEEGQDGDQEQEGDQDQENQDGDQSDDQNEQSENEQEQQGEQQQQDQEQGEDQPEEQEQQQRDGEQGDQQEQPSGNQQQESPLPQFTDLEDMTAEEAAAILEAVENLEREQRREEALAAAKANVGGKKDW